MQTPRPVVLTILDGWGLSEDTSSNAPVLANTPTMDRLFATCPNATLTTFGPNVGLPTGQMGNSEVGHTNIGAGRIVAMDLGQIDLAIEDGSFFRNAAMLDFAARVKAAGGVAHLMCVVSDGGVHGHILHGQAAVRLMISHGLKVVVHAITDGRDVAPQSAEDFVAALVASLPQGASIGTVIGRYYAMDRDNRWERVEKAYDAMVLAKGEHARDAVSAVAQSYKNNVTDEFILPTVIDGYEGFKAGDGLFCLNFRADRAREILLAIGANDFDGFPREKPVLSALLGMVEYSTRHSHFMTTAYPKRDIVNTLGAWVAKQGLTQFRLAETEKYPHVTFFLNGGKEEPEVGEDRFMPKSPKVATYDLQPEMSAPEVTEKFVEAIGKGYDLIVTNYANPDMVGHTGDLQAAIKACEAVDRGLGAVVAALEKVGGAMLVIADHGNCETMVDPVTGGPHTAHTTNPVPVILFGGPEGAKLHAGILADVAPTLLQLMNVPLPPEMTGKSLIDL
ncbi:MULTISPECIES: 2,3-bisphosphoglycerate-independent phosphoglycerate mutase [Agrobacterium]|jgi:2,3-bisphosphoglycerate-independent phosphoglycerate mutase|uniref:2,3-bisphosphoglycerate-independent phosphoglycerate mutase n=3 Tax=Agrobacterium tumefaciens complex TaxID=1183400 RepID=A0AAP9J7Y2_AGRTU|nr:MULTISPECIES: 2,3-bisphosphoglycerate-independent phosphoglycerate mutase [Agrobacterium tumefaciens complex]AYM07596.1 phosphoglyceromutase [Agrobacterium tumefaciens]AYM83297.1 phosphoglyceromutase [Agrobacterium tumefaciens]EHH05007.1 phosphoglyceromutase [Agrobacterium tumefaciens CCNWGS0286]MBB4407286.1 2,3-bisphosphoglycerate-independent phosphoglycerate mutase [Agrobacterium radiobacter]MBB4452510.1 2,3-bisphosphoglycerate-independent phosphoglycerate mutase [Agrobacterium radiobacte